MLSMSHMVNMSTPQWIRLENMATHGGHPSTKALHLKPEMPHTDRGPTLCLEVFCKRFGPLLVYYSCCQVILPCNLCRSLMSPFLSNIWKQGRGIPETPATNCWGGDTATSVQQKCTCVYMFAHTPAYRFANMPHKLDDMTDVCKDSLPLSLYIYIYIKKYFI